jgi:hypothetical protein
LRRTDEYGAVSLLGRVFHVDRNWCHRLVRAEVDTRSQRIGFYTLRRREPSSQPLLNSVPYVFPHRSFKE